MLVLVGIFLLALALPARLDLPVSGASVGAARSRRGRLGISLVGVGVRVVVVARAAGRDAQPLVHGDKRHEPNEDG